MLYLGKNPDNSERLLYDPADLTTHAVCLGMTGSGKTGLCLVLMEEVIRSGVPVFLIDPKGDLCNLLLAFPGLTAAEFAPWIDPEQARAAGKTPEQFAETVAARWREGLAGSALAAADVGALRDAAQFTIYTPGSTAGTPVNVLGGFAPPQGQDWDVDPEPLRARIAGTIAALLDLVEIDADPVKSPEAIFLAKLFETRWRSGEAITLESIIRGLQDLSEAMRTLGAMDTETLLPRKRRLEVAMALNGLLAAPSFSAWTQGEPLDIARMVRSDDGRRPRASVLHIAHLSDRERMFFVSAFLQSVINWMRSQPGSSSLKALVYMDEIFGYFPPVGNPPSKEPLLTLLKQARAFGVGVLLASQNPVDLDYKGLANAGTWFLGRMQTEQDRARLLDGLSGTGADRAAVGSALAALPARTFLLHDVRKTGLRRFTTRWALSYLRGPMTREEIKKLRTAPAPGPAIAGPAATGAEAGPGRPIREQPPAGIPEWFAAAPAGALLFPALRARARVSFELPGSAGRASRDEDLVLVLEPGVQPGGLRWDRARPLSEATTAEPATQPPAQARYADLPDDFRSAAAFKTAAAGLRDFLVMRRTLPAISHGALKLSSRPDEDRAAFLQRCQDEARRRLDAEIAPLKAKYEERIRKLQARAEKELRELECDKQQHESRKMDELVNAGETLLGMFLGGRRRSVTGIAGRHRMTSNSAADVEKSQAEYDDARAELDRMHQEAEKSLDELESRFTVRAESLEEIALSPVKSGTQVIETGLIWIAK